MTYTQRLLACVVLSVLGHFLLARAAELLPKEKPPAAEKKVTVRVIEPPPPKPPPPPPPPPPETPAVQSVAKPPPRRHPAAVTKPPPPSQKPPPPTERPAQATDTTTTPVFGVTMESTSQAGTGPALPTGNTLEAPTAEKAKPADKGKRLPPPLEAYAVQKMPLPIGRCSGQYTDEARAAAVEGTVVLDLVVGADGRPRQIKVVHGLPHGLTKAALRAVQRCRFTPGQRDGKAVPVQIRSFKVTFSLRTAD